MDRGEQELVKEIETEDKRGKGNGIEVAAADDDDKGNEFEYSEWQNE